MMRMLFSLPGFLEEALTPSRSSGNTQGQLYTADALLAIVLFVFAVALISALGGQLQEQMASNTGYYYTTQRAQHVSQALFFTRGEPIYWHTLTDRNQVEQVGLLEHGQISPLKWEEFQDWNATDYASLQRVLGIPDLNFYITFADTNRNIISHAGIAPSDVNMVYATRFPATYQNAPIQVAVQMHRS